MRSAQEKPMTMEDWVGLNTIDHFLVTFCLCIRTSLRAKSFMCRGVSPSGSFSCKSNSFSFERFFSRTRFETEAKVTRK